MYKLIEAFDEYLENVKKRYPEITKELVYYDEKSADAKRMGEALEKYQGEMWDNPIIKLRKSELNKLMKNAAASASLRSLIRLCYKNTKKKEFVVLFNDGTKETTKYDNEKDFTPYVGFALCVVKKIFGSNTAFHNTVNELYKSDDKKPELKIEQTVYLTEDEKKEMESKGDSGNGTNKEFVKTFKPKRLDEYLNEIVEEEKKEIERLNEEVRALKEIIQNNMLRSSANESGI